MKSKKQEVKLGIKKAQSTMQEVLESSLNPLSKEKNKLEAKRNELEKEQENLEEKAAILQGQFNSELE
jgi:uncharacterized protein YoxC